MLDFYESILNINRYDKKDALILLDKTISDEIVEVKKHVNEMDGLCKVIFNNYGGNIYEENSKQNIR